jgi:2-methylisocitrate lyase-like PEP mutase family enzyme
MTQSKFQTQREKAELFHAMHEELLVLPNAWDAGTARVIESAGAKAIATTSAGISWALGVPDGQKLERAAMLNMVKYISATVDVPITVDVEGGYGTKLEEVALTIEKSILAGAVGVNLEDSGNGGNPLLSSEDYGKRIAIARQVSESYNLNLFINARLDAFLLNIGDSDNRISAIIERAEKALSAGANGIFIPGLIDKTTIMSLAQKIKAPLNIMATPQAPSVSELAKLGVRRVSLGMAIAQASFHLAFQSARNLLEVGTYSLLEKGFDYHEINQLLTK